jgi:hypothetical protein
MAQELVQQMELQLKHFGTDDGDTVGARVGTTVGMADGAVIVGAADVVKLGP